MGKKHPNRFNIEFRQDNPVHLEAIKILNNYRNKTDIIALAICAYNKPPAKKDKDSNLEIMKFLKETITDIVEHSLSKYLNSEGIQFNLSKANQETNNKEEIIEIEAIDVEIDEAIISKFQENNNSEIIDVNSSELDSDIIQGLANFGIKFNNTED